MLARLWVSKNVSGFHIISWAVSLGPFIPLVSLLFCLFSFIFTRGHVQSSDKYIDRHSFLLRPVIAGDNDEMLISFFKCMQLHRSRLPGGRHHWQLRSGSTHGKRAQFRYTFSVQHGFIVYQNNFTFFFFFFTKRFFFLEFPLKSFCSPSVLC